MRPVKRERVAQSGAKLKFCDDVVANQKTSSRRCRWVRRAIRLFLTKDSGMNMLVLIQFLGVEQGIFNVVGLVIRQTHEAETDMTK